MAKNNVNIKLERNLWETDRISFDRYTIYVNAKKYVTGYIDPIPWDVKIHWRRYMETEEQLERIKKMYYWLFE